MADCYFDMEVDEEENNSLYGDEGGNDDDNSGSDVENGNVKIITPRIVTPRIITPRVLAPSKTVEKAFVHSTPVTDLEEVSNDSNNKSEKILKPSTVTKKDDKKKDESNDKKKDDSDDDIILLDSDEETDNGKGKKKIHKPMPLPKSMMTFTVKIFTKGTGNNKMYICGFEGCTHSCKDFQAVMDHTKDHFRTRLKKEPEIVVQHVKRTVTHRQEVDTTYNYDNELILDDTGPEGESLPMINTSGVTGVNQSTIDGIKLLNTVSMPSNQQILLPTLYQIPGMGNVLFAPATPQQQPNIVTTTSNCSPKIVSVTTLAGEKNASPKTPTQDYKCLEKGCGLSFLSQLGLSIHSRVHTTEGKETTPISTTQSLRSMKPNNSMFRCTAANCSREFKSYMEYLQHREIHKTPSVAKSNGVSTTNNATPKLYSAPKPAEKNGTNPSQSSFLSAFMSQVEKNKIGVQREKLERREKIRAADEKKAREAARKRAKAAPAPTPVEQPGDNSEKLVMCSVENCGVIVPEGEYASHLVIHSLATSYACPKSGCGEEFETYEEYKEHKNVHAKVLKYPCSIPGCKKSFNTKRALLAHHKEQHKTKSYRCIVEECKRFFRSLHFLKCHLQLKHEMKLDGNENIDCKFAECSESFANLLEIQRHIFKTHMMVKKNLASQSSDEEDEVLDADCKVPEVEFNEHDGEVALDAKFVDMELPLWYETDGCLTEEGKMAETGKVRYYNENSDESEFEMSEEDDEDEEPEGLTSDDEWKPSSADLETVQRKRKRR